MISQIRCLYLLSINAKICFFTDPPSVTFEEVNPIKDGGSLYLFCNASGVPTPTTTIYRNGKEFAGPFHGALGHTITSASAKNDHGTYSCNASSISSTTGRPFLTASKSIQVIVQGLITDPVQYGNPICLVVNRCT